MTSGGAPMSDRVGFVLGGWDGLLSHFLSQPLQDFHAWYEGALQEFPEEFDAARWRLLGDIVQRGPSAIDQAPPADVNFLMLDYYGDYANVHNLLQDLHEYWDKLVSHQRMVDMFQQRGHLLAAELLAHTVMGRLAIPDPGFPLQEWGDYPLSFWTAAEVVTLKSALDELNEDALSRAVDDELLHALQTTREAMDIAASQSTGLIIFVGW